MRFFLCRFIFSVKQYFNYRLSFPVGSHPTGNGLRKLTVTTERIGCDVESFKTINSTLIPYKLKINSKGGGSIDRHQQQ